ncbi:MAG: hypothetical protein RL077_1059 [Verrucomicrobiota bacterium]|jgi:uncharacterized protein
MSEDLREPPEVVRSPHLVGYWKRRSAAVFRWLHIYVSMASFGILFFFALTGLTLNHADAFSGEPAVAVESHGALARQWVEALEEGRLAKFEIVEWLRRVHGVRGLVGEFRLEDDRWVVTFKGPGYAAEAHLERASGAYLLRETRMGLVAVINDLHKGRDTGRGWSWVVDLSACLLVAVSLSGMVLIYFVRRHFVNGLVVAASGILLSYLAYAWLVP